MTSILMKKIALFGSLFLSLSTAKAQLNVTPYMELPYQEAVQITMVEDEYKRKFLIGYNENDELLVSLVDSNNLLRLNAKIPFKSIGIDFISPLGANFSDNFLNIYQHINNNGVATLQQLRINPFTLEIAYDNYIHTTITKAVNIPTYQWYDVPNHYYIRVQQVDSLNNTSEEWQLFDSKNKHLKTIPLKHDLYKNIALLDQKTIDNAIFILARAQQVKDDKSVIIYTQVNNTLDTIVYKKLDILKAEDIISAQIAYDNDSKTYHFLSTKPKSLQKEDKYLQFNNTWTAVSTDTTIHKLLRYPTLRMIKRKVATNNTLYALMPKKWTANSKSLTILYEEWIIDKKAATTILNPNTDKTLRTNATGIIAMQFDTTNVANTIAYLPYTSTQALLNANEIAHNNSYLSTNMDYGTWHTIPTEPHNVYITEAENNVTLRTKKKNLSPATAKNVRTHVYQLSDNTSFDYINDYANVILNYESIFTTSNGDKYIIGWDKALHKKIIYSIK